MRKRTLLRNTPPEWNTRPLTKEDFKRYCEAWDVKVFTDKEVEGQEVVFSFSGRTQIYIDRSLSKIEQLYKGMHAFGHIWLHPFGINHFLGQDPIDEEEAEVVAVCAMIPRRDVMLSDDEDLYLAYQDHPDWMIQFRRIVFDTYKL